MHPRRNTARTLTVLCTPRCEHANVIPAWHCRTGQARVWWALPLPLLTRTCVVCACHRTHARTIAGWSVTVASDPPASPHARGPISRGVYSLNCCNPVAAMVDEAPPRFVPLIHTMPSSRGRCRALIAGPPPEWRNIPNTSACTGPHVPPISIRSLSKPFRRPPTVPITRHHVMTSVLRIMCVVVRIQNGAAAVSWVAGWGGLRAYGHSIQSVTPRHAASFSTLPSQWRCQPPQQDRNGSWEGYGWRGSN